VITISGTSSVYLTRARYPHDPARRIVKQIRGEARLTEANIQDALREVRVALLEADVALPVVKHFIDAVRARALARRWSAASRPARRWSASCTASSRASWARRTRASTSRAAAAVILMAGLQGSGKTTTSGKLALALKNEKKKVGLVLDRRPNRPAAIDQLRTLAGQAGSEFIESKNR